MKRKIARLTWAARETFGLTRKVGIGPADIPFERAPARGRSPTARLDALDVDVERVVRGWDQHIPQVLAAIANVRADLFEGEQRHATQLRALGEAVALLEAEVSRLKSDKLESQSSPDSQRFATLGETPSPALEPRRIDIPVKGRLD